MAEDQIQRHLAAIVAADVAGYSRLMGNDEAGTLAALKSHRRELIDPKIAEHGGRIVKTTGDGILLEFASVADAVRCALEIQTGMLQRNAETPVNRRILFRVGVNLGDVISEGDDIFGHGVNIAARLESIADPGGICISRSVLDQLRSRLDLNIEDMGERALKNIEEPVRAYRIVSAVTADRTPSAPASIPASPGELLPLPTRPALAILPFRNIQGGPEADFIADGIGLGIQTLLVQLSGLFFVNACSHQAYKEGKATAKEAVANVPVRYVLEGAVQRFGGQVRVTVQLTDIEADGVVWAERYDRDFEDIFALQDDITREAISSLSSEILKTDIDHIWTRSMCRSGASEYFLRGLSHFYKQTEKDNALARQMAEKVYEQLPKRSIGPSYIALTYWFDASRGWNAPRATSLQQTRKWAEQAVAMPDEHNNGLGYVILGSLKLLERRHDEALALCTKGISFRASCPFALGQLALVQTYCGKEHEAVRNAHEALSVRMAYQPLLLNVLAMAYRDSGEIGSSIPAAREAARLDAENADAQVILCSDYALAGNGNEASDIAGRIVTVDPGFRVSSYAARQPYREASRLARITDALKSAGLPE